MRFLELRKRGAALALAILTGLGLGATAVAPAAQANAACNVVSVCLYQCHLSDSCGYSMQVPYTITACTNILPYHLNVYSIKNHTYYQWRVYHTSNCTGTSALIYAQSVGDMNYEWEGDSIASIKRVG